MISSGVVGAGGCRGRGEPVPVLSGADGLGTPQGRRLKCQPLTAKGSHPSKEGSGSQGSAGGRGEMPWLGANRDPAGPGSGLHSLHFSVCFSR